MSNGIFIQTITNLGARLVYFPENKLFFRPRVSKKSMECLYWKDIPYNNKLKFF
jgi:hypothetical protein